ncbi:UNVERIFIED_CONTAM: hypothetical protein RMT77_010246 [Armadillidium vulgare]
MTFVGLSDVGLFKLNGQTKVYQCYRANQTTKMKFIIFACLLALAVARPDAPRRSYSAPSQSVRSYSAPSQSVRSNSHEVIEILRDDRFHPEDGKYSFDVETEDGIVRSESGSRLEDVENEPVGQQGSVSFTFPNGEEFSLKFVADENGFQPESAWLPVAPEFPHPIPQFVLDQIEKAAREDAEAERQPSRPAQQPSSGNRRYYN